MAVSLGALVIVIITLCSVMAFSINHIEAFSDRCDILTGFVDTLDQGLSTNPQSSKSQRRLASQSNWRKKIKEGKVVGGYSSQNNLHVCQGFSKSNGVVPGETWSGKEYCVIGNAGKQENAANFNYLDSSQNLYWSKLPTSKVIGGKQNGVDQHVCRGRVNKDLHIGRTWSGYNACNIGLNNVESALSDFEYLSYPDKATDASVFMTSIQGIDSVGNDIASSTKVPDGDTCQNLCRSTPACHVASYSKSGSDCWLKHDIAPASLQSNADITTYAKLPKAASGSVANNTDFPNNDMAAIKSISQSDCGQLCAAIPECKLSVWEGPVSSGKNCWIKSSRSTPVSNANRQAWVRT